MAPAAASSFATAKKVAQQPGLPRGGGARGRPAPQPFRWGLAASLIGFAALLIGVSLQWADQFHANERQRNPKPAQSTMTPDSQDTIPRGDEANPNAVYRLRGHQVVPSGQRHVVNFSDAQLAPCASATAAPQDIAMSSCIPPQHLCTRIVVDSFVSDSVADNIVRIMKNILKRYGNGGGSGPVSLVDLNMGVVSMADKFVSLVHLLKKGTGGAASSSSSPSSSSSALALTVEDVDTYHLLVKKIHAYVSETLFCDSAPCATDRDRDLARRKGRDSLFVSGPSFFSQIGGSASDDASKFHARTVNDEYWHEHVDQDQYGTFAVTTLLYLNTLNDLEALDTFQGGQFEFGGPLPGTVEPRKGRLSIFTSGREHPHWVAPVLEGYRYALTTAFTCNAPKGAAGGASQVFYVEGGKGEQSFLHAVRQAV
ncbi:2OG-Fe(II) oxygenase, putative [Bodo saltans]|uniref:2OG-Fe(II) oxygenase, putative n=1 Tax=Bodo saltans TaxID=75058 RepID=A0A0S4IKA9_BODSA|nr:2OG-Fe(II) oxygenase, putative [Bodo saltans]|eukprot:CUF04713.1 2OG-Fe(II) oxygenase, putative [Bodo saltans]